MKLAKTKSLEYSFSLKACKCLHRLNTTKI